ncbi:MAG: GTPase HflX [Candidatus Neomarinimicrobiota bacterium]|uniref:Hflx-type G domain-containing protein n=1 Tax=marine metagenome TaxID=408172 RepID=A0A381RL69_9ZZZZ|nr:GTPase HflX [Candidatus Neomarinimicrobiota bacterium]
MDKAILVGIILPQNNQIDIDNHLSELSLLAETAEIAVLGEITQKLVKVNPAFFVGKGKASQVIEQAKVLDANLIIFDEELSPAQIKNYHKLAKDIKVIDRSALILDIFKKHAKTREAKTQVELAFCQYLLPRLTRQWTHLERQMGGVGTRAGMGETQIEIDRRLIRDKISKLKLDLKKIEIERTTQSQKRKREFRVALVGYTNAGKSTLFNSLTGNNVFVQDQLFATLDTTVRKLKINKTHQVLISDTVGFIRKLPHNLVASFRSTLKELLEADLILIVLDASSVIIDDHLDTIKRVLTDLGADDIPKSLVLNKIDRVQEELELKRLRNKFPDAIIISALHHLRLDDVRNHIIDKIESDFEIFDLKIPYHKGKTISQLQDQVEILESVYGDEEIFLKIKGRKDTVEKILG